MNIPQFPFRCPYQITQRYSDNANHYPEGHHGAWDVVPLKNGVFWPAPIFPLYGGSEIAIQNNDPVKGKGIRERVTLDDHFKGYLKSKNCLVGSDWPITDGKFYLDILYWHMLKVDDGDGTADISTPLGPAGNTGDVYSGGVPVPNSEKGKPPYRGGHLHLETSIYCDSSVFVGYMNRDKDPAGRIDPQIIFNYPCSMVLGYKKVNDPTVYVQLGGNCLVPLADWQAFVNVGGSDTSVVVLADSEFSKFQVVSKDLFKSE